MNFFHELFTKYQNGSWNSCSNSCAVHECVVYEQKKFINCLVHWLYHMFSSICSMNITAVILFSIININRLTNLSWTQKILWLWYSCNPLILNKSRTFAHPMTVGVVYGIAIFIWITIEIADRPCRFAKKLVTSVEFW